MEAGKCLYGPLVSSSGNNRKCNPWAFGVVITFGSSCKIHPSFGIVSHLNGVEAQVNGKGQLRVRIFQITLALHDFSAVTLLTGLYSGCIHHDNCGGEGEEGSSFCLFVSDGSGDVIHSHLLPLFLLPLHSSCHSGFSVAVYWEDFPPMHTFAATPG